MKTYLSIIFYFLGDVVSYFLHYNITSIIFYPIYRRLMLISISLDKDNIVWQNEANKKTKKKDLIAKLKKYK